MNQNIYSGTLRAPSQNFQAVRDGRNTRIFYQDIDLTTARTADVISAVVLPLAGNFFYIDLDPSFSGYATASFEDSNTDSTPLFVGPGFTSHIPYTRIKIYNTAQPGKKLRIIYGTDVDFTASQTPQYVTVRPEAGIANINTSIASTAPPQAVDFGAWTAAQNANGVILYAADIYMNNTVAGAKMWINANPATSLTITTGQRILSTIARQTTGAVFYDRDTLQRPIFIPAGNILYWGSNTLGTIADISINYKLL